MRLCLPDAWVDLEAAAEAIHRAVALYGQQVSKMATAHDRLVRLRRSKTGRPPS